MLEQNGTHHWISGVLQKANKERLGEAADLLARRKARAERRWKRVDGAFHWGEELPPVSLYMAGGHYFVLDGHHRVRVTSYHGVEWIDAEATEFNSGLWSGESKTS